MSKKKNLIPEMRFPEFKNEGLWVEKTLGEIGEVLMCKRVFAEETNPNDGIPFFKIGTFGRVPDAFISFEKYNEFKSKYSFPNVGDILISASGTIGRLVIYDGSPAYFQDSNIVWLRNNEANVLNSFLFYCYSNLKWQTSDGGIISRLYNSDLKRMKIRIPKNKKEQQKIASCISSLDELIAAHDQKLDLLKDHKKGLMLSFFPQEGENVPKYRFKEFEKDGNWIKETVGDIYDFKVTNSLAREYLNYEDGLVKNIHYGDIHTKFNTLFDITKEKVPFINPGVSIEKIKKENYCAVGDIVFADASEDLNDVGKSIEIVNLNKEKLVSGLHTLLARQKEKKLAIGFGGYLFKSNWVRKQIQKESQGAKVLGISATRISNVQILYPKNHNEQEAISLCLCSLDEIIKAQESKIEQLKEHKIGLMQALFPKMYD